VAKPTLIKSFAKLNLFLDVLCKRKDGYHNIETIFQTVSLHDEISLELISSGLEIHCDDPSVPSDPQNLAARAFLAIQRVLTYKGGIRILIRKKIPPGSGLGGGSSNAAAVLRGVNRLLNGGISGREMHEIACQLGADIPFFLSGGLAAGWGIGEKLMPLASLPESIFLIAVPAGVSVSTPVAYRKIAAPECGKLAPEDFSGCGERLKGFVDALYPSIPISSNVSVFRFFYNELEVPVFALFPEIAQLKKNMLKAGAAAALMSGSGSGVFGVAETLEEAASIQRRLEASCPCRCYIATTVNSGSFT
jgi:4-diphosphocytidyl-2-C-methyl-D-erythritol kinase